jgi:transposase InsO family protein
VKRLLEHHDSPTANVPVCNRRGPAKQRPRRERQRRLRHDLVVFARWTDALGLSLPDTAELLKLAPRTLRQWRLDLAAATPPVLPLGRPTLRSPCADRNDVLAIIDELGPRVGVLELKACCPHMSRAELADLLMRYRRVWRARRKLPLHVLDWRVPGTIWAMDFAFAPHPIDGLYPYLLAVRDLASGQQLLWRPLRTATAAETIPALLPLFMLHGAPLVLKTDNGSPFIAEDILAFFKQWFVLPLFSPPRVPQYNGSIEAAVGSMKSRTEEHATREGRPTQWTWHDTEAARAQANATARPRGLNQPTPDQSWNARPLLSAEQRSELAATVEVNRLRARFDGGWPLDGPLPVQTARALDRQAIPRALVEHGFLLYSRRQIPLPFPKRKTADIS